MTRNGKDRLAAALGESYPRVWRGLGLESKNARNLPAIQDKKRTREDDRVGHPYLSITSVMVSRRPSPLNWQQGLPAKGATPSFTMRPNQISTFK